MNQITALALPGSAIVDAYAAVRERTELYAAHLGPEDQAIQSMPDASPARWHRAHTTWFFEQFILRRFRPDLPPFDDDFNYLFNSYYQSLGERHPRATRGLVTRPTTDEVTAYRAHVDRAMTELMRGNDDPELARLVRLGLAHEEQHQELLLTDIMHGFAQNPLSWGRRPIAVLPGWTEPTQPASEDGLAKFEGGVVESGTAPQADRFVFDNESPRHHVYLQPFAIATTLVRNRDWLDFVADGGYRRPEFWMAEGWDCASREGWSAPLYWRQTGEGATLQMSLGGAVPLDTQAPVRHVSWYEADAYARWKGARLPTEHELEHAADSLPGFSGHVWQWTNSAYLAYPGYRPPEGAIGEYNGKFMINQMVLRGGSFATSPDHSRATYRNFFNPDKRWQVTGLRLAQDR